MNFFNKFFKRNKNRNRNENPLFTIIKEAFPIDFDFSDYTIYHIKSFEYKESNIELFDKCIKEEDFYKILDTLNYNSQSNNIGVYYLLNSNGEGMIYLLYDPIELWEKGYILKNIKYL